MADDIVVNIAFKGNAADFLAELSRQVGRAKTQLQELGQSTAQLSRMENILARASTQAAGFAGSANKAAAATQGWSQKWTPFKGQFLEAEAASKGLWRSIDSGIAQAEASLGRASAAVRKFDNDQRAAADTRIGGAGMAEWDKQFATLSKAADENVRKMQAARQAVEQYQNSLSNARYVLYDVAGTLTIMGAGFVTPLAAAVGVAVNFEKAFAQVARTSGLVGDELGKLKAEVDDLYGSIPITYDALAKIATLAGQLGVPAARIGAFTEAVAKTSAVTDLSVEQAATAFGRLDALIPNVKGQYDRLGSSIAKVGVNSVATESDIVNISTQISSMGSFAGLTAQDVIGLSGALASIGAQPELSRGTVTRVFSLMSRAVNNGGESLQKFADVSGVSAKDFTAAWGTPQFSSVFLKFMNGIREEGGQAVATLDELGITSVRDVPLLLRLANAADSTGQAGKLLAQTIGDANSGWSENIELQRQYDIIAGTVAAKVEVLANNFNLFLQAIGGPMLSGLGDLVDFLTDVAKGATDFAQSDLGGTILRVVVILGALLGVLALAGGAMALFGASSIGVYQALLFLGQASPRAAAAILGTAGAAALADGSLKAGAASALAFSRALKAISIIGAILILPELLKGIGEGLDSMAGKDYSKPAGAIKELANSTDLLGQSWRGGGGIDRNVAADFANSLTSVGRAALATDDMLKGLVSAGNITEVVKQLNSFDKQALDVDAGGTLELFHSVVDAAKAAGYEIEVVGGKIKVVGGESAGAAAGTDGLSGSMQDLAAETEAAVGVLDEMKQILFDIGGTQMSAAAASDAMWGAINRATEALAAEGVVMGGTNTTSLEFSGSLRDIEERSREAGVAILENKGSTEEATAAWAIGRNAIIDMIAPMFESRDAAIAWADQNLGSSQQVQDAMANASAAIDAIPDQHTTSLFVETGSAYRDIDEFIWKFNSIPTYKGVTIETIMGNPSMGGGALPTKRAGGGSVWGAGTATSDSILARLSNGEFVIRTEAAKAIGYGRLDHMNRYGKMPGFAGGGQVGRGGGIQQSVMELGPRTMRALSRQVVNMIAIDNQAIADSARAGNANQAWRGGNR